MKTAITGASGFIGTELRERLAETDNIEMIALTRGESAQADSSRCVWKTTDYTVESLTEVLKGADAVIHLAGARGTTSDPADYVVNQEMTENILKAMAAAGTKRIVFASTISVYDDTDLIPWPEDTVLKGRTAYGDSKIRCEELIRTYAGEYGFSYGIVRIAQVLGSGERRRGMMNVFLDTAAAGGEIHVIGKSTAKRQYLYVKDLTAILSELACGRACSENITVNAGMPHAYTNLEIAEIVNKVYDNKTPIDYDDSKPETIRASFMKIDRLRDSIGYVPMDMEEAVRDLKAL